MDVFSSDAFVLPLPPGHRFPMAKYALLRERLLESGVVRPGQLRTPLPATDAELAHAHDPAFVRRVVEGRLDRAAVRAMGFPWSPQLVERSRRSVGATLGALRSALRAGAIGVNLAGGTHHAFPDRASGYCVFNDVAVALRVLLAEGGIGRAAVIDLDVHQGDGTACAFRDEPRVFTLSLHGRRNFPFHKQASDFDVALEDGTGDRFYLGALAGALAAALSARPDAVVYLAGADPWREDRLGRLALSREGLLERDRMVLDACAAAGAPVAVVMAGGYAERLEDTVEIHAATVAEAARRGLR